MEVGVASKKEKSFLNVECYGVGNIIRLIGIRYHNAQFTHFFKGLCISFALN